MKKPTRFVAVLATLALVTAACNSTEGGGGPDKDATFLLKLGVVTSFTGDLSAYGKPVNRGVELAVEALNTALAAAGSKITVSSASADDQTTPAAGVEAANKVVADGATVIIGPLGSGVAIPVVTSVAKPKSIVGISPSATAAGLTTLDDGGFFFRTVLSDFLQAKLVVSTMQEIFGKDATINAGGRNDAYGSGLIDAFTTLWKEGGGQVPTSIKWDPKQAGFDSEAQQLTSGTPDGWFIVDFPETWKKVGTALQRTGKWDIKKTFTTDGLKSGSLNKDAGATLAEGIQGSAPGDAKPGSALGADAFDKLWKEKAGIPRQTFDGNSFDAAIVAGLAAVAAGSNAGTDIKGKMAEVSGPGGTKYTLENLTQAITDILDGKDVDYEGATGPIDFDSNGDSGTAGATYVLWEYTGGKVVTQKTIDADTLV